MLPTSTGTAASTSHRSDYGVGTFIRDPGGENEFAVLVNLDLWKFVSKKTDAVTQKLRYVGIDPDR